MASEVGEPGVMSGKARERREWATVRLLGSIGRVG